MKPNMLQLTAKRWKKGGISCMIQTTWEGSMRVYMVLAKSFFTSNSYFHCKLQKIRHSFTLLLVFKVLYRKQGKPISCFLLSPIQNFKNRKQNKINVIF